MDSSIFGYSLDDFKEEARELLNRAEEIIGRIESSPGDHEDINALFRTIHSLKGSAGYVGLENVTLFAHLYESFLGDLRQKKYEVDPDVTNLLTRSRDYLDDLVFLYEDTPAPIIDETVLETKKRITDTLMSRRQGTGGSGSKDSAIGSLRKEAEDQTVTDFSSISVDEDEVQANLLKVKAEEKLIEEARAQAQAQAQVPSPTVEVPSQPEPKPKPKPEPKPQPEVRATEEASAEMDEQQVITVTVIKSLNQLYDILMNRPDEKDEMTKVLDKMEETLTWAYGDEADTVVVYIQDIKGVVKRPDYGTEEVERIKGGFNGLLNSVKTLIDYKDEAEPEQEPQAEPTPSQLEPAVTTPTPAAATAPVEQAPPVEEEPISSSYEGHSMEEATSTEILTIAVNRDLAILGDEIKKTPYDKDALKSVVKKLKEINQWAFDENEDAHATLLAAETLLLRDYDENVAKELTIRAAVIKTTFEELLENEEGVTSEEVRQAIEEKLKPEVQRASREEEGFGQRRRARQRKLRPGGVKSKSGGVSLRVKQDDIEELIETVGNIKGISQVELEKLQKNALELRMVPVGELFGRFRKVVRDLSEELDKGIDIEIFGESVKLDKVLADKLNEPMIHMVRNAASHGIESDKEREALDKGRAKITLNSYQEGGQIIIEVSDDGRGMDVEVIRRKAIEKGVITEKDANEMGDRQILECIFAPGFSTKDSADSVSGRGVGMDVVKEVITSLHGSVLIDTTIGKGTVFRIQLPLTLAIIKAMILEQGGNKIAVPIASVDRVLNMTEEEFAKDSFVDKDRPSLYLSDEGVVLPIVSLYENFGFNALSQNRCVVILRVGGGQRVAYMVESAHSRQSLAVKPLDKFSESKFFSSAAMFEEEVVLILNIPSLVAA